MLRTLGFGEWVTLLNWTERVLDIPLWVLSWWRKLLMRCLREEFYNGEFDPGSG
jgi:hypothetical protein